MGTISNNDNNDIKLSVAIPTYNGAKYIREALDSIITQLDDIDEEIEIVISDNASTDETPEIIREYQKKYPLIKYFRNEENLGADRHFDLAVRRAKGKFVWLLSDNDLIKPCAIREVIDVIGKHYDLAAIFVNWGDYSNELKTCITERVVDKKKDVFYEDADDFLSDLKLSAIFVSSDIFNRSLWEKVKTEQYIGTSWIQYATMMEIIIRHNAYFISEPYVIHRSGDPQWNKTSEWRININFSLLKILKIFQNNGYSKKSINKCKKEIIRSLPGYIVEFKKSGIEIKKFRIKDMISEFRPFTYFWIFVLPMIMMPNMFYRSKLFGLLYKILHNLNSIWVGNMFH